MGFGDKLKELRDQAQSAVAENKDKIQGAVMTVGEAANTKTKGKYADKIAKVGEKVTSSVDKMGSASEDEAAPSAETTTAEAPAAPEAAAQPATPATPAGSPPEFDD
jgi:gas vesicle protein